MLYTCLLLCLGNTLHYTGALLGVTADVTLLTRPSRADIRLRGIPVGGSLQGGASYDAEYRVDLDDDFERRLRRLRVKILSVTPSPAMDHVYVVVRLPFFLGTRTIALAQNSKAVLTASC